MVRVHTLPLIRMKRFSLNIYKTDNRGWLYLLPSVEYRHKAWYLWQLSFSWLRWSFTLEVTDNEEAEE